MTHQTFHEGDAYRGGDQPVGEFFQTAESGLSVFTVPLSGHFAACCPGKPAAALARCSVQQPVHASPGAVEAVVERVDRVLVLDVAGRNGEVGAQPLAGAERHDLEGVVEVATGSLVARADQTEQNQTDGVSGWALQPCKLGLDHLNDAALMERAPKLHDRAVSHLGRLV
ncbi:hypothetical protein [Streptomyces sp. NPDC048473]|uniref:hypothetical protein n=1 Tax=unclassified Streptomyces TaxID=2593676 RepID=UPI003711FEA9